MTTENSLEDFRLRLTTLTQTLFIAPTVPDNQVLDRVALTFRKLLNFLAQDAVLSQQAFGSEEKHVLVNALSVNLLACQQSGLFRKDLSAQWLARCFVGMLDQMKEEPGNAAMRHQQSIACAKVLCEGIWPGAADSRV